LTPRLFLKSCCLGALLHGELSHLCLVGTPLLHLVELSSGQVSASDIGVSPCFEAGVSTDPGLEPISHYVYLLVAGKVQK
jgi:hypothetical protein